MRRRPTWIRLDPSTLLVAFAALLCVLALPPRATAAEAKVGEIGGPPTIPLGAPDEGKRTTPDIVIGRGRDFEGGVELVAYGWELTGYAGPPQRGVCIWAAYLSSRELNFQGCVLTEESRAGGAVEVTTGTLKVQPRSERWTQFGGRVAPDVSAVRVTFRRPNRDGSFRVNPIVAQVDGALQQKLKMPEAFGLFTVRVAGLVPRRMFKVQPVRDIGQLWTGQRVPRNRPRLIRSPTGLRLARVR